MKTVYFVRHGQSETNANIEAGKGQGVFQGISSPLTEKGREQARFIAERAAKLPIDIILTSHAVRARMTAEEIQRATGKPLEVVELFVERMSPTSILGKPRSDAAARELLTHWQRTFCTADTRIEDGENFEDLRKRVADALRYLEARPEKHILVATHGYFLHMVIVVVMLGGNVTVDEFRRAVRRVWVDNTGITQLEFMTPEDGKHMDGELYDGWVLRAWNDHAHLG